MNQVCDGATGIISANDTISLGIRMIYKICEVRHGYMVLDNNGNWVIDISVMIVYDTIILVKRVTCDIIEVYYVIELNQNDIYIYIYIYMVRVYIYIY